jgi:hypothetical protein
MALFQTIVLTAATIILILALCFIGLALYRQKYNSKFPPIIANCPDFWTDVSISGNGSDCKDMTPPLGNASCPRTMDFSSANWSGNNGPCSKSKWAKQCNLSWDGITNNADVCGGSEENPK